ncbi:GtrA family protein [Pedobacter montanisoli]|uniref:GtrA family protein n=1 Tax=Pedobacter montanisoli TaxID=2923277 RepID=A0ABS9ZY40_9SPHI|nr:GtrA family protein [Pedobacter montanisoli]MCJ0743241.1 GtrA family protein [Pedobacter montanisoli]
MGFAQTLRSILLPVIDFFYPPFKRVMDLQTFRYAVCGGSNALLNLVIFFLAYNFIFKQEFIHIAGFDITRYIAAYIVALSISFPIGFILNKFIVFQQSNLESRVQLFRYGFVTATSILFDYLLLHLLVGYFQFWATPSQAFIIVILSLYSYLCQTYFTFKTVK